MIEEILLSFTNRILENISEYEEDTSYSDEVQEFTKLKTLVDIQQVIKDTLQEEFDKINTKC